jgi:AcrR family transcriptional regulator
VGTRLRSSGLAAPPPAGGPLTGGGARRSEILETAAALFASSGYVSTSLKDIADACGILPGSLYHHFESKEALVIELLERYQSELDSIGNAALAMLDLEDAPSPTFEQVVSLATTIADSARRNRAALQLTIYDPPSSASSHLTGLARRRPLAINAALQALFHRCQAAGLIWPGIDTFVLAEQMSHALRLVGIASLNPGPADQVAATLCHMLFYGVAARPPGDAELDRSAAKAAADNVVRAWAAPKDAGLDDKVAALRAVARTEFARRGYEATTARDLAAAAGVGTGSVYRIIESKEALVISIMDTFHRTVSDGYDAVLAAESTTVEKLDALTWVSVNVRERFSEELAIQQAWLRSTPPATIINLGELHEARSEQIARLIAGGFRSGEMHAGRMGAATPPLDVLSSCVRNLVWVPRQIIELQRSRPSLKHARATLLRGAATGEPHS